MELIEDSISSSAVHHQQQIDVEQSEPTISPIEFDILFQKIQEKPLPEVNDRWTDDPIWKRVRQLARVEANSRKLTLMSLVVIGGRLELVQFLHTQCLAPIDDCIRLQKTNSEPIHLAASAGHVHVVKYLIDNGVNVNARDEDQMSAVERAIEFGRVDVLHLLADHQANLSVKRPIKLALKSKSSKTLDFVVKHCFAGRSNEEIFRSVNRKRPLHLVLTQIVQCPFDKKPYLDLFEHLTKNEHIDVNLKCERCRRTAFEQSLNLSEYQCARMLLLTGRCDLRQIHWPDSLAKLNSNFESIFRVLYLNGLKFDCDRLRNKLWNDLQKEHHYLTDSNRSNPFFGSPEVLHYIAEQLSPSYDGFEDESDSPLSTSHTEEEGEEEEENESSYSSSDESFVNNLHWMFSFLNEIEREQKSIQSLKDLCRISLQRHNCTSYYLANCRLPKIVRNQLLCSSVISDPSSPTSTSSFPF